MEPVKRTRSFDFDGHTFTITMAAPDTGIGVTQSAVIEQTRSRYSDYDF
jgi:hypothetical protein